MHDRHFKSSETKRSHVLGCAVCESEVTVRGHKVNQAVSDAKMVQRSIETISPFRFGTQDINIEPHHPINSGTTQDNVIQFAITKWWR